MATDLRYIDDKISKLGHPVQKHTPYHANSISTGDNIYDYVWDCNIGFM